MTCRRRPRTSIPSSRRSATSCRGSAAAPARRPTGARSTRIIGSGFDAMGWVPEGQRSGQMSYSTSSKSATFVTIGEEDAATFEAISAGREFEDIQARMTFRLLQKMMLKEEMAILAGNASLLLGTPATPTLVGLGRRRDAAGRDLFRQRRRPDPRRLPELERLRRRRHHQDRHRRRRQDASRSPAARRTSAPRRARRSPSARPCSAASPRSRGRSPMLGTSRPRPGPRPCRRSPRSTASRFRRRSAPATSRRPRSPPTIRPIRAMPMTGC